MARLTSNGPAMALDFLTLYIVILLNSLTVSVI